MSHTVRHVPEKRVSADQPSSAPRASEDAPATRRVAGKDAASSPPDAEGLDLSDELDEESETDPERQAIEEALEEVEREIEKAEKDLAAAKERGDHEEARRLSAHLDDLMETRGALRDALSGGLDASDTAPGATATGAPQASGVPTAGGGFPAAGAPSGGFPTGGAPSGGYPTGGAPSGGYPTGGAQPASAVTPSAAPAAPRAPGDPLVRPGSRVLVIGDSHTAGTFGTELDRKLRATGAQVETYGSSGSSPSWWRDGTTTRSGFVARHADGSVEHPPWQQPHATPKLQELISKFKPDVLVVNLGANMRGASPEQMRREVAALGEIAKTSGTKLIWVGPPKTRADMANSASIDAFNAAMRSAVAPYGAYLDSSSRTRYSGSDGVHYNGADGSAAARRWAAGIFSEIQQTP
ncbi:MAG: hypothetical protein FJX76_12075 [Armatimonadetes bacterium]|nr:hypothetical protein [Armatimonadota bacterium]